MSHDKPLGVVLIGAGGRMGSFARDLLEKEECFALIAALGRSEKLAERLCEAREQGARVALDLTLAGLGARHAMAALHAGLRPVIGTSGVSQSECEELDVLARELSLGGIVVPNFSLGIWLQLELTRLAARHLPAVEIIEEHGAHKKDAPSGTAVHTAAAIAETLSVPAQSIPIHSLRLPGVRSNQSVVFGGPGQLLRLTHETYGYEAFAPGILSSLRFAAQTVGVQVGVGHAFGWEAQD